MRFHKGRPLLCRVILMLVSLSVPPQAGFTRESTIGEISTLVPAFTGQLVLWGSIVRFGEGVLAQPLLTVLLDENRDLGDAATWSVSTKDADLRLSVTIPRVRYELPPIMLGNDLLELYRTQHL